MKMKKDNVSLFMSLSRNILPFQWLYVPEYIFVDRILVVAEIFSLENCDVIVIFVQKSNKFCLKLCNNYADIQIFPSFRGAQIPPLKFLTHNILSI